MRALAKELKSGDERLDLALKKELKVIAGEIVPESREAAQRHKPNPRTREHDGEWKWAQLVKSITAGADQDGPFVKTTADKLPGAMGFAFGSDKRPQFPPRRPKGYFLWPQIDQAREEAGERIEAVVTEYLEKLGGG